MATATPNPSATLTAGTANQTATLTSAGYAVSISLPATSDGSTGPIAASLSTTLPSGVVAPANIRRAPKTLGVTLNPLVYLVLTPSASVAFSSTPGFSFTLPAGTSLPTGASAGVAYDDPTQPANGWSSLFNAGTISGQTITFSATSGAFTLKAGTTYAFVLYTTAQLVTPTPKLVSISGPTLNIDLTKTNLPTNANVYVYIVGNIGGSSQYYMKATGNPQQPYVMATMVPGKTYTPTADQCTAAYNGDNVHFYTCDNDELGSLPAPAMSALIGANGTGGNYPQAWADYSIPATVGQTLQLPLSAIGAIPGIGTGLSGFSGRIYISVGVPKLPFTVQSSSGYAAPVFGNGTGSPGQYTLFDWIEFSYGSDGTFDGNTTQVNQYGFSLQLSGSDTANGNISAPQILTPSRTTILSAIAALPSPYGGTSPTGWGAVVAAPASAAPAYPTTIGSNLYLRAIAPQTIVAVGSYPAWSAIAPAPATCPASTANLRNTFDCPLSVAYTTWQSTPLVVHDPATGYYFGYVFPPSSSIPQPPGYAPGALAFYYTPPVAPATLPTTPPGYTAGASVTLSQFAGWVANGSLTYAFSMVPPAAGFGPPNQITSSDIWENNGSFTVVPATVPAAPYKNVGKIIAAAFQRGIAVTGTSALTYLGDSATDCLSPTAYYPAGGTFNPWSHYFHANSTPVQGTTNIGLAYGFSYDDLCGQNPSIPLPTSTKNFTPGTVTVTLGNF